MKHKKDHSVKLEDIYMSEVKRTGDKFSLRFYPGRQQIAYILESKGTLTVSFIKDHPNDPIRLTFGFYPGSDPLPEEFKQIMKDYYQPEVREKMGIDHLQLKKIGYRELERESKPRKKNKDYTK